eukprot:799428_1
MPQKENLTRVVDVTTENMFEEYFENSDSKPLLIDFYATWCGPCKQIAPKLAQLSTQYTNIQFLKIDVNKLEDLSQEYQISAMPTFVFIRNKKEISRIRGADINGIIKQLNTLTANIETVQKK